MASLFPKARTASLIRSTASPSLARSYAAAAGHQGAHSNPWGYYSLIGFGVLGVGHIFILSQSHTHEHRHEYSHMKQLRKRFPFRDGQTPLFGDREADEHH